MGTAKRVEIETRLAEYAAQAAGADRAFKRADDRRRMGEDSPDERARALAWRYATAGARRAYGKAIAEVAEVDQDILDAIVNRLSMRAHAPADTPTDEIQARIDAPTDAIRDAVKRSTGVDLWAV
ncbi:hypothetical protein [Frankia sp. Cj3]|uniref:hypothetical protein n=1 Tax=Frankia sp. Cj3 TaxID=2880976 RepID=UPI001EF42F84|nr:hypothetical protein [Frankia sp. Cj3]